MLQLWDIQRRDGLKKQKQPSCRLLYGTVTCCFQSHICVDLLV